MEKNILNRKLPSSLFGIKIRPYKGIHNSEIIGNKACAPYQKQYITRKTKRFFDSIDDLFSNLSLKNGMTLSFHHSLRDGDNIILPIINTIASYNIKNVNIASTALFPVHAPLIEHIETGVIGRIESSMNGPIGNALSKGDIDIPTVLRSHGGRARAVQDGSINIDIAFIAASVSDYIGNLNGINGIHNFGSMGYPLDTDSLYAKTVVGVTDTISNSPLQHISIPSSRIDAILQVDKIGDPKKIATGSLGRKIGDDRLKIAQNAVEVMWLSGFLIDGFNWQAGAGGTSIASAKILKDLMEDKDLKGGYIFGGIAGNSVELLEADLFDVIYDAQSFDLAAVNSLKNNPHHIEMSIDHAYNPYNKGCLANNTDFCALGATEVDLNFNTNVNTFSNGLLNSGIGGHQDAARAKISMILIPLARKVPTIKSSVTTISTPGDSIDVIVTEDGVAINPKTTPKRKELLKRLKDGEIPLKSIEDLKAESESAASPMDANLTEKVVSLIEYRDGTHLDVIYQMES